MASANINNTNFSPEEGGSDLQGIAYLQGFAFICAKTHKTIKEITASLQQMKNFHQEQLEKGEVSFSSGRKRVDAVDNINKLQLGLEEAAHATQDIMAQVQQQIPIMAKTTAPTLGMGSSETGSDAEEEEK